MWLSLKNKVWTPQQATSAGRMEVSDNLPVPADPAEPREGVPVDVEGPPVGGGCELHVVVAVLQLCIQISLLWGRKTAFC